MLTNTCQPHSSDTHRCSQMANNCQPHSSDTPRLPSLACLPVLALSCQPHIEGNTSLRRNQYTSQSDRAGTCPVVHLAAFCRTCLLRIWPRTHLPPVMLPSLSLAVPRSLSLASKPCIQSVRRSTNTCQPHRTGSLGRSRCCCGTCLLRIWHRTHLPPVMLPSSRIPRSLSLASKPCIQSVLCRPGMCPQRIAGTSPARAGHCTLPPRTRRRPQPSSCLR